MGCVSSKHFKDKIQREILFANADYTNHIVSLTSSTYGALQLDKEIAPEPQLQQRKSVSGLDPEIINTWELMQDLEEGGGGLPNSIPPKRSPKPRSFLRGLADLDPKTPLKLLNSPKKFKKSVGKENKGQIGGINRWDNSPKSASNNVDNSRKKSPSLTTPLKPHLTGLDLGVISSRRRSLGPLFDPEHVESFEKESVQEKEDQHMIKKMVSTESESESLLQVFAKKCPPGGEKSVVIYTTTLRGIRKTFEDCNAARRAIESHGVEMIERDVSMDSGYKEELRGLMGTKQVKVPVVFVKGRVIGGAEEIVRLEEEGKLGILFEGIGKARAGGCRGCDGVRFVMCVVCNGSCKVLDEEGKISVKCGVCNENGLIHCPLCCCC